MPQGTTGMGRAGSLSGDLGRRREPRPEPPTGGAGPGALGRRSASERAPAHRGRGPPRIGSAVDTQGPSGPTRSGSRDGDDETSRGQWPRVNSSARTSVRACARGFGRALVTGHGCRHVRLRRVAAPPGSRHLPMKRGGPQDRQRDATSPRSRRGESRRGGERPRGRNRTVTVGIVTPKGCPRAAWEWTRRCQSESPSEGTRSGPQGCGVERAGARDGSTVEGRLDLMSGRDELPAREGRSGRRSVTAAAVTKATQGSACFGMGAWSRASRGGAGNGASPRRPRGRPTTRNDHGDGPYGPRT